MPEIQLTGLGCAQASVPLWGPAGAFSPEPALPLYSRIWEEQLPFETAPNSARSQLYGAHTAVPSPTRASSKPLGLAQEQTVRVGLWPQTSVPF